MADTLDEILRQLQEPEDLDVWMGQQAGESGLGYSPDPTVDEYMTMSAPQQPIAELVAPEAQQFQAQQAGDAQRQALQRLQGRRAQDAAELEQAREQGYVGFGLSALRNLLSGGKRATPQQLAQTMTAPTQQVMRLQAARRQAAAQAAERQRQAGLEERKMALGERTQTERTALGREKLAAEAPMQALELELAQTKRDAEQLALGNAQEMSQADSPTSNRIRERLTRFSEAVRMPGVLPEDLSQYTGHEMADMLRQIEPRMRIAGTRGGAGGGLGGPGARQAALGGEVEVVADAFQRMDPNLNREEAMQRARGTRAKERTRIAREERGRQEKQSGDEIKFAQAQSEWRPQLAASGEGYNTIGRLPPASQAKVMRSLLRDEIPAGMLTPEEQIARQKVSDIVNAEIKQAAGTAVSANEMQRVLGGLGISFTGNPQTFVSQLGNLARRKREQWLDIQAGFQPGVVSRVRERRGGGGQTQQPQGGIVRVRKPDGTVVSVKRENLQRAIELGGEEVVDGQR